MPGLGQLGKIKFIFYKKNSLPGIGIPYSPAYNPTSFSVSHSTTYDDGQKTETANTSKKFNKVNPQSLSMELFFDGTGASPSSSDLLGKAASAIGIGSNTVDIQIAAFLKLAKIDGDIHEPPFVMVIWGTYIMTGVLTSANVTYTMFDSNGRPLRAKMNITIEENVSLDLLGKLLSLFSPDLSKSITVKEGDTLPLLCSQEYNDASLYTKVAAVNNLKNYRKLKQGMELLFPPIDNLA